MTKLDIPDIANGWVVDAGILWRGAQPQGAYAPWEALYDKGCRTIIDLNTTGEQAIISQMSYANGLGMASFCLQWDGVKVPSQLQIETALQLIAIHSNAAPVFVHCEHGSDRTGTLCACWRIYHDKWSVEKAVAESLFCLGFGGLHEGWMEAAVAEYAETHK